MAKFFDKEEYPTLINKWKNQFSKASFIWLDKKAKIRSRQGLYEFLDHQFKKIQVGMNVLTIGSDGEVFHRLKKISYTNSFKLTSFDVVNDKKPDILGDICTYHLGTEVFDTIVCSEVIEHLHSPQSAVKNMFDSLKPGGKLIVTIPFIFPIHADPHDYVRYTKTGLKNTFSMFSSVEVYERNSYFEAIDVLWMRTLYLKSENAFLLTRIILPIVFYIKRPFTLLLNRLFPTDAMTTGYNIVAIK